MSSRAHTLCTHIYAGFGENSCIFFFPPRRRHVSHGNADGHPASPAHNHSHIDDDDDKNPTATHARIPPPGIHHARQSPEDLEGLVYYYNTSPVFADEVVSAAAGSSSSSRGTIDAPPQFDDSELPTVDSVLENKRRQIQARLEKKHEASPAEKADGPAASGAVDAGAQEGGGAAALEEEAGQQGAFNPETGEINWDCPCLGGMAHGPCGEEFRTAFSCFVYSNEEPKGMDCIEKFQYVFHTK